MLVSIVMPLYNTDIRMLEKAIDSILEQSYKEYELIIVCDRLRESSDLIVKKYAERDTRIFVIRNDCNIGLAKSLNEGIKRAKGKYIARMDADDVSWINRIKTQVEFLENRPDVGVVFSRVRKIDETGKILKRSSPNLTEKRILTSLFYGCLLTHPTVMIRKSALDNMPYWYCPNRKAEDYDLWTRMILNDIKIAQISKVLYDYRVHSNQLSMRNKSVLSFEAIDIVYQLLLNCGISITTNEVGQYLKYMTTIEPMKNNEIKVAKDVLKRIISNKKIEVSSYYLHRRWILMIIRRILQR